MGFCRNRNGRYLLGLFKFGMPLFGLPLFGMKSAKRQKLRGYTKEDFEQKYNESEIEQTGQFQTKISKNASSSVMFE